MFKLGWSSGFDGFFQDLGCICSLSRRRAEHLSVCGVAEGSGALDFDVQGELSLLGVACGGLRALLTVSSLMDMRL